MVDPKREPLRAQRSTGYSPWRAFAIAIALSGVSGAIIDWLILLSQFTQRGDVSPFLPPITAFGLALGVVVGGVAIVVVRSEGPRPWVSLSLAVGSMLVALLGALVYARETSSADIAYSILWAGPIACVAVPLAVLVGVLTERRWKWGVILGLMLTVPVTVAFMLIL